jgi:isopenicillin-N N-acyltransferase-like protein
MVEAHSQEQPIPRVEMRIIGSYREAGRDYGEVYAADIQRQIDAYEPVFDLLGLGKETVAQRAQERVLPATEHAYADYVDELRGRADGAGVAFRDLFSLSCLEEVWSWVGPEKMRELEELATGSHLSGHCTTFALSRDHRALIGHNEDWSAVDLHTTMLVHDVTVPSGTRFLSLQLVGLLPWSGLNSHGLAITANTLPATDAKAGAANAFVLRRLLECRDLKEVWDCLRMPRWGLGAYVLAADAQGHIWAMETSARRAACRPVETWTAETNHFTDETMVSLRTEPVSEDSLGRLARAEELIGPAMDRDEDISSLARRVLTDHHATLGRAICGHPQRDVPPPLQIATMATTVYETADRRLWVTPAPPCEHEPQLFELN